MLVQNNACKKIAYACRTCNLAILRHVQSFPDMWYVVIDVDLNTSWDPLLPEAGLKTLANNIMSAVLQGLEKRDGIYPGVGTGAGTL